MCNRSCLYTYFRRLFFTMVAQQADSCGSRSAASCLLLNQAFMLRQQGQSMQGMTQPWFDLHSLLMLCAGRSWLGA